MVDRKAVREALARLGKRRTVLAIHDVSFPSAPGEDTGRGTPYSRGGRAFIELAHNLGFDGIQLGPQGQTSEINRSPYDGTLFSKSELSIDLHGLARDPEWGALLTRDEVDAVVGGNPGPDSGRAEYLYAFSAYREALDRAYQRFVDQRASGEASAMAIDAELDAFRAKEAAWLERDALYTVLEAFHGGRSWREWSALGAGRHDAMLFRPDLTELRVGAESACEARRQALATKYAARLERYAFAQLIVHRQHAQLRDVTSSLGMVLFGDVQVGISVRDVWSWGSVLLQGYKMGAPPSRTNPDGQPWGYGVLDPALYTTESGEPGPVKRFLRRRLDKMLAEFDGLRVDHPHGFICPWVYRWGRGSGETDPIRAVQGGARLFSSPDRDDLARFAIAGAEQLAGSGTPRYAEGWVESLDDGQVEQYAALLDVFVEAAADRDGELICEVLSTQPYPLYRVMQRHGLGRFRVTQKANLDDPADVYRCENARPEDWVMVGNHDTPPLWRLVRETWPRSGQTARQADFLAARLAPSGETDEMARRLRESPSELAHAKMAEAFASPARQVMIFFADLLGIQAIYNRPGTISDENWSLRVPNDVVTSYERKRQSGEVLDLPRVLAMALRARGLGEECAELIERLVV